MKSVENFLDGDDLLPLTVDSLPDDSVGSLSELLNDLVFLENMWFDLLSHFAEFEKSSAVS